MKYGFIGCGNMGGAIARAVCKAEKPAEVLLSNRSPEKALALAGELGCQTGTNADAANCAFIFLGVKPQMMRQALEPLQSQLAARNDEFVLVTMAAGLSMAAIRELAGGDYPVIRIMPNTPAAIGAGMIQYCCDGISSEAEAAFLYAMTACGRLDKLDESLIDAASSVSGCGPAWACMFLEALADGGVICGLPRQKAMEYAAQMLLGTAQLVLESGKHPGLLKDQVCSPAGSTIQGVRTLEAAAFRGAVTDAVIAAYERTKQLGRK